MRMVAVRKKGLPIALAMGRPFAFPL